MNTAPSNRTRPTPSPAPPPKTKPARRKPTPPRIDNVFADLRDRIACARPIGSEPLGRVASEIAGTATAARVLGEDPHHADETVATDARELLLATAALSIAAVIELDRRTLALPPAATGA